MKTTNSQKLNLGLFVIIGTLLFIVGIYFIGQKDNLFKETFSINANFKNVNGLQKGNNVRYSGINIGTVKAITMVNDSAIKVDMAIDEELVIHIKKNAIATIGSDGLVGNMIINIVPGKGNAKAIANGDTIKSYSKIGTDDILSTLSVTGENTAILTAKLLKITEALAEGKGTLGILLNDTIMANDLRLSIKSLKRASYGATTTINELNGTIKAIQTNDETILGVLLHDTLTGKKLKTIVSNLETSSTQVETVVSNIKGIVTDLDSDKGALSYIINDTVLVHDLKSTIKNITEGTDKFNQNMEALKHNFLTRGYFRKLERQEKRALKKDAN
ncbi:MlaD family protein [Lacinutrix sp. Hel_I_90]|uniref:MlaD family protein n=1 Tax=Lacinutrix sp. Hel_I_90 TaxID=1249999 RepID=UPI0005C823FE|nr:MlaD family protein [Lacinutrix sp. Hel_I_90]